MEFQTLLQQELRTFESRRAELVAQHEGRFVLIRLSEVAGTFEKEKEAVDEGYRRFGNVPFLVAEVLATDRPGCI